MDKEFFDKAYEEEYQNVEPEKDNSVDTNNEPTSETPTLENVDEEVKIDEDVDKSIDTEQVDDTPKYKVDDKEYTLEEIKEAFQGNMRQSDYTRKTQELAKQRKEYEEAVKFYEHVKKNPEALRAISDIEGVEEYTDKLTPEVQKIQELEYKLAEEKLDKTITDLKSKYPDFDEVKVLSEADKRNIFDLEFVYKAMRDEQPVDVEAIKRQAIEDAKKQLMEEINNDKISTQGSIVSTENSTPQNIPGNSLTEAEKRYCDRRGWDYSYYEEIKNTNY